MDDKRRIAMVENTTIGGSGPPGPQWRFELGNLLDSVAMELDAHGAVISYEEYHPFGTTGFQSFGSSVLSKKRYRYTGKEKDDETGLYYHGARYYAPWLGRWTAADPAGFVDGPNLYAYGGNDPLRFSDSTGTHADNDDRGAGGTGGTSAPTEDRRKSATGDDVETRVPIKERGESGAGGNVATQPDRGESGAGARYGGHNPIGEQLEKERLVTLKHDRWLRDQLLDPWSGPLDITKVDLPEFKATGPWKDLQAQYQAITQAAQWRVLPNLGNSFMVLGALPTLATTDNLVYQAETFEQLQLLQTPVMVLSAVGLARFQLSLNLGAPPARSGISPDDYTQLYQKVGPAEEHLKFGITLDMDARYSEKQLGGGRLKLLAEGPRRLMLKLERGLHENLPIGPEEGQKAYLDIQARKGLKVPPY